MIKLSAEEILRIADVNDYSVARLKEAYETLSKVQQKVINEEQVYASTIGYVMGILDSIHEILTRPLENSEANGTATGKKISE